jgi:hypothetical protein
MKCLKLSHSCLFKVPKFPISTHQVQLGKQAIVTRSNEVVEIWTNSFFFTYVHKWAWLTKEKVLKIDEYISNIWTLCKILEYFIMGFWKLGAQRR